MADRHTEPRTMLRTLKLPAMADHVADLALKAAKAGLTHEAFLYEVVQWEVTERDQRRIARLLEHSALRQEKTFRTLKLDCFALAMRQQLEHLRTGRFIEEAVNVLAVGKPGTGKSHLAAARGHELVLQGRRVLWTPMATLVQRLLAAKRDSRLPRLLTQLDRFACVILDPIRLESFRAQEANGRQPRASPSARASPRPDENKDNHQ